MEANEKSVAVAWDANLWQTGIVCEKSYQFPGDTRDLLPEGNCEPFAMSGQWSLFVHDPVFLLQIIF